MNKSDQPQVPTQPSWKIPRWFSEIDSTAQKNLKTYWEELIKFNKTVNLISPKTVVNADSVHFGDSIKSAKLVYENNNNINEISDLGTGNGFPGLVFAMLYSNLQVNLIDVDQRKCEFLKHVVAKCGLKNVSVQVKNIERLDDNCMDFAITRGFASIPKAMMMLRRTVKLGGCIYFLKSEEWSQEVMTLPSQLCSIWTPELVGEYSPPDSAARFFVIKAKKISEPAG